MVKQAFFDEPQQSRPRSRSRSKWVFAFTAAALVFISLTNFASLRDTVHVRVPLHAEENLVRCRAIHTQPGAREDFHSRERSERFEPGTPATLIKNGKIWTGGDKGNEVIEADILLNNGIIKGLGYFTESELAQYTSLKVVDAKSAWVTPGIVDIHSHLGDSSSPELEGAADDNSLKGNAQPWLRSLDGINTHDDSYPLSVSGGVTTSLILPGSANAIGMSIRMGLDSRLYERFAGGQAFVIKLRKTSERSPTSMLLEPPPQLNNSDPSLSSHWRHMK
jgi:hypothetical protein